MDFWCVKSTFGLSSGLALLLHGVMATFAQTLYKFFAGFRQKASYLGRLAGLIYETFETFFQLTISIVS